MNRSTSLLYVLIFYISFLTPLLIVGHFILTYFEVSIITQLSWLSIVLFLVCALGPVKIYRWIEYHLEEAHAEIVRNIDQ